MSHMDHYDAFSAFNLILKPYAFNCMEKSDQDVKITLFVFNWK